MLNQRDNAPALGDNVTRDVLPSGLTVLVKENHNAPVAALLAFVRIGYFNEPDRVNGIAHVVEHMIFKGTENRPEDEQIAREVRELGGQLNASTYYEETSYYIVVPSDKLDSAMEIQADMFQNSRFEADSLAKEIEVIVQESLQKRDNPTAMLVESLYALAFDQHRIRRWRIGLPETLRAMTHDDLISFVNASYRPENITLAIVGDVNRADVSAMVRRYWGDAPKGELRKEDSPEEPPRTDFRYQRLAGETRQRLFLLAVPAPPILHPDAVPLMVASSLLSSGRSARLFRKLKEELRLVSSAWASYDGFETLGLFTFGAECLSPDPLPVQSALWAEITRLQSEPVSGDELARVKRRVESNRLYAQEEVLGVARTLANYESLGDYRLADELLARLRAVTATDVQRVAQTYFKLEGASLMEYLPQTEAADVPERTPGEVRAALNGEWKGNEGGIKGNREEDEDTPGSSSFLPQPSSLPLPGVGTLLYKRRDDLPVVSINLLVQGGKRSETRANAGITSLMLRSSLKGTTTRTAEQIASDIEGLGSGIGTSLAADYLGYGMKITGDALDDAWAVFRDVLTNPTFPAEEVEREKQAMLSDLRRQQDNSVSVAMDLFAATYFGDEHPYGLPSIGIREAIEALTPADLADWHKRHFTPSEYVVAIVGDLDEAQAVALAETLRDNVNQSSHATVAEHPNPNTEHRFPAERVVDRAKKQTATVLGWPGATPYDADRVVLDVLAEIVSGMGGRFFRVVRGENALAYSVAGFHRSRMQSGNFLAYALTAPENEALARELLLAECEKLGRELVTEDELRMAKTAIVGEHVIGTQTFGAQSGELAVTGVYGLPLDEPQQYLGRVQAVTREQIREVAARYLRTDQYWAGIARGGASPEIT